MNELIHLKKSSALAPPQWDTAIVTTPENLLRLLSTHENTVHLCLHHELIQSIYVGLMGLFACFGLCRLWPGYAVFTQLGGDGVPGAGVSGAL